MRPKEIWKFEVQIRDRFTLSFPKEDHSVLCVQMQNGRPMLWVAVNPDAPIGHRTFCLRGTGQPLDFGTGPNSYIGTFQMEGFVWHLFTRGEDNGTRQF